MPLAAYWLLNSAMVLATLAGMTGNGLVTYFFVRRKVKMTSFNLLLLNLSIADLLADVFAYLHIFVDLKMLRGFSRSTANILCAFTIGITPFSIVLSASIFTLTYISLNRFIFVKYPMKTAWFKSRRKTLIFIALCWTVAIGFMIPNIFAFRYERDNALCYREWPEIINVPLYTTCGVVLGLLLPIGIMLLALFATKRQFKKTKSSTSANSETEKRKRRTVKLLGFLIIAFFVCMAPSLTYLTLSLAFVSIWPPGIKGEHLRMVIIRVTFLITLLNTVADPIIYGYNNKEFKDCFKQIFSDLHCSYKRRWNTYRVRAAESTDVVKASETSTPSAQTDSSSL